MRPFATAAALVALSASAFAGSTGDPAEGRVLAARRAVCHGLNGLGTNPTVPNVGGESEMYLTKQLQDFREGRRVNEQMSIMVEGLTAAEIADPAAWYSAITITVTMPDQRRVRVAARPAGHRAG